MHIESPYRPDEPAPRASRARLRVSRGAGGGRRATPAAQPLSRMRQAIGSRMVQSLQTAATCTTIAEADMSRIEAARKAGRRSATCPTSARDDRDPARVPGAQRDARGRPAHGLRRRVHLGIAVSLGEGGLIVPVIRDAQDLSVEGLAKRIKDLARARAANQLTPDEVSGGTFTITNPGGVRLDHGHAGDQPAAGGDPRHRGRGQAPGGRHGRARQRLDRDPPDDVPVHALGPPRARRRARGADSCARCARSWRPGRSADHAPWRHSTLPACGIDDVHPPPQLQP